MSSKSEIQFSWHSIDAGEKFKIAKNRWYCKLIEHFPESRLYEAKSSGKVHLIVVPKPKLEIWVTWKKGNTFLLHAGGGLLARGLTAREAIQFIDLIKEVKP